MLFHSLLILLLSGELEAEELEPVLAQPQLDGNDYSSSLAKRASSLRFDLHRDS